MNLETKTMGTMTDGPDEYPSEAELPDEPITVDDIDPFTVDGEDFDSVNDFAIAEFVAQYCLYNEEEEIDE